MGIPEIIVVYLLANSFIGNKLELKKILKISIIYGILCYIIKNLLYSGIVTVSTFILVVVLYSLSAKISPLISIVLFALTYGIKFVSEFIVITFADNQGFELAYVLSNPILKTIFLYMTLIIPLIIVYLNLKKDVNLLNLHRKRKVKVDKGGLITHSLIILGSLNIIIVSIIVATSSVNNYRTYKNYELIFVMMIIASVISLIIIVINLEKRKDIALIEKNLVASNLKQMEETVDLLRIQRHDVMNHLQIILMQINNGKNEDARKYILGLAEDVKNIGIVFNTGNNYIDAILNFKNRKCIDSQIELTACIDSLLENTCLEDTQLSSIFLNIIDNAIDELRKCEVEYKYIHVDTFIEKINMLYQLRIMVLKSKTLKKYLEWECHLKEVIEAMVYFQLSNYF